MVVMLVVSTLQRVNNSLKIILHEIRNEVSISNLESRSEPASSLVRDGWTDNDNQMDIVNIIPRYVTCVLDLVPTIGSGGNFPDVWKTATVTQIYKAAIQIIITIVDLSHF
ncbi:unnamed protein product [Arctia plantaginis]|uniref:Uncharacterized protein n=1 Tax=Arctia plantaginis TaxID=874455 RepID=A0A8S0ZF63_ARCPL|nr:unnamed protein product [Arctia plantaginis]